jgi:hypothetical protein
MQSSGCERGGLAFGPDPVFLALAASRGMRGQGLKT